MLEPSQHQTGPTVWRLGQKQNAYNKPSHVQTYRCWVWQQEWKKFTKKGFCSEI